MPTQKPHKSKKWIKYIAIIALAIMAIQLFIYIQYGSIDLKGTWATQYHNTETPSHQIIETQYFKLKTPKNWFHIFGGYGLEGYPCGAFQTPNGVLLYEYGMFAPRYKYDIDGTSYLIEVKNIRSIQICVTRNKHGETGIYIPMQAEMKYPFAIYPSHFISHHLNEILNSIKTIQFTSKHTS